jgi:hypothetical protein
VIDFEFFYPGTDPLSHMFFQALLKIWGYSFCAI